MKVKPIIDFTALEDLKVLDNEGAPSILHQLYDLYKTHAPEQIQKIKASVSTGDVAVMSKEAHSLKSSSATLGLRTVQEIAKALEMQGRAGSIQGADAKVRDLELAYQESLVALKNYLKDSKT